MAAPAAASTCSAAVYRLAAFMKQPAPVDNIYELLSPVWWVMDGKPISSYPFSTFWPQLAAYARRNGKVPMDGVLTLSAIMLLTLLFFVLWRFVRCIRVVCCQQETYADANKVLFSKRLRFMKGLTVALGLVACAAAAWGMSSLDKDILPALNARIDSMQEFPVKVVQQVASLANDTAALNQPLSNISSIIDSIDARGIRHDVEQVAVFLEEAPSPSTLRATLQQLSSALRPQLYDALRQLHSQVNVASDTSPLSTLKGYLDTLVDFDISSMGPAVRSYSTALSAMFDVITSDRRNAAVQASPEFARLRSSSEQVDLDAWVPYIDQAVTTANAINALRTPSTNPFTITLKSLTAVLNTINGIRGKALPSLSTTVEKFNGMWHNNASVAFESLLERATRLNHTVLELPGDVEHKLALVNASITDLTRLYNDKDSLLNLPQKIQEAGAKLTMPDAARLIADLKAAEAELNDARGLPELITKLATLARALDRTLRDAKGNIQPSLDAFAADARMRLDLQDTLTFEGPVVQGVADVLESVNLQGFKDYTRSVLSRLDSTLEPARRQADAIPGVLQQIGDFDVIKNFMTPLQQAEQVYKQFGSQPANLTKPVFDMLDRVSRLGDEELATAQAMVNNVSSSVQQMSNTIRDAAVEQIDKFQANYLGKSTNSSSAKAAAGREPMVKAVHAVYNGMMAVYGTIVGLLLIVLLMVLLNCPAGICFWSFLLNISLVAVSLIPLLLTVGLLLIRDTCGNLEAITTRAVAHKAGNGSLPAIVSEYYMLGGAGAGNGSSSLPDIIKGVNAEYDVVAFKSRVQQSMEDMLKSVAGDYALRPQVSAVVSDASSRISDLMGEMDSVLMSLDHSAVSGVYHQGKNFFCCSLANQVYIQWAATITLVAVAWCAMQFALLVLGKLDTLSESCCRFRPYRSKDYGPSNKPITGASGATLSPRKRGDKAASRQLQPMDSNSSETVAVISLGGSALPAGLSSTKTSSGGRTTGYHSATSTGSGTELPDCTPLPPPLKIKTGTAHASMGSPRRAPAPAHLEGPQEGTRKPHILIGTMQPQQPTQHQAQQQQRRPRVADTRPLINITAVYPSVVPSLPSMPNSPSAAQREQQQAAWATTPGGIPGKGLVRAPCTRI